MGFKVINRRTGREISDEIITKIAKKLGLIETHIDGFYTGEDGQLILMDDTGHAGFFNPDEYGFRIMRDDGPNACFEYFAEIMHKNLEDIHPEYYDENTGCPLVDFIEMFPQIWSDTAGGFSKPGMMSGQALTTQVTTIMRITPWDGDEEYYGVFFDNKFAYIVEDANEIFFNDLRNHTIRSVYEAEKTYK